MPVTLRDTTCGLPVALSAIVSVPFRVPAVFGVKVTSIVQFAPDARVEPQVSVSPKLPLVAILAIFSVVVP